MLRPELISYILFVGLVRLAEKAVHPADGPGEWTWRDLLHPGRPVGGAVLLTLVWAQCHGFSALAPVIWLMAGLAAWLDRKIRRDQMQAIRWKLWFSGFGLLVLAQLATPNGLAGLTYPIRALGQFTGDGTDLRQTISELSPLLTSRDSLGLSVCFKNGMLTAANSDQADAKVLGALQAEGLIDQFGDVLVRIPVERVRDLEYLFLGRDEEQ